MLFCDGGDSVCRKYFYLVFRSAIKNRAKSRNIGGKTENYPRSRESIFACFSPSASINYVVIERSSASVRGRLVIKIHECIALSRVRLMRMGENEIKRETFWSLSKVSRESFRFHRESFILYEAFRPTGRDVISGIVRYCYVYVYLCIPTLLA